jgi:hypothetical protein
LSLEGFQRWMSCQLTVKEIDLTDLTKETWTDPSALETTQQEQVEWTCYALIYRKR